MWPFSVKVDDKELSFREEVKRLRLYPACRYGDIGIGMSPGKATFWVVVLVCVEGRWISRRI